MASGFDLFDRIIAPARLGSLPVTSMWIDDSVFSIGTRNWPFPQSDRPLIKLMPSPNNLISLKLMETEFILGEITQRYTVNAGIQYQFNAQLADSITFTKYHSRLNIPMPFRVSFIGPPPPRWKRRTYFQLVWKKPSGQSIHIAWSETQQFYKRAGWCDEWNTRLISVRQ